MEETPPLTPQQRQQVKTLAKLERFSRWTDSQFKIPFTKISFGFDSLVGLIPGVGDGAGFLLSAYVFYQAVRIGAPASIKSKMLGNMAVDTIGGFLPLLGDVFDVYFKANTRNTELLKEWLESELAPQEKSSINMQSLLWLVVGVGGSLAILALLWFAVFSVIGAA